MIRWLRDELRGLLRALTGVERGTAVVLVMAAVLSLAQDRWGHQRVFRNHLAELVGAEPSGLGQYLWHHGTQCLSGFVIPVVILLVVLRRPWRDVGLGLGNWKLGLAIAALYVPLVTVGCWLLSAQPAFADTYPNFAPAADDWGVFLIYQLTCLVYWVGWEYLWRGFVLFGTAPTFGRAAIFVQMVPFAVLHLHKPPVEAFLSVLGGLALGAVVWQCRSFWIAVPIHAYQMAAMDFFCALRSRGDL